MAKAKARKKRAKPRRRAPGKATKKTMNGFPVREVKARDLSAFTAAYNPRDIDEEALEGLKASTGRFGLVQPILWNKRTGNLVGGHQRLKTLGPDEVTDVVVLDLSLTEEKALNVALNNPKIQGTWSDGIEDLLREIHVEVPDLADSMGIDSLLEDFGKPVYETEVVRIKDLKPHPRNYKDHPEDQLEEIAASIKQHGFYRNIAIARDNTILAGHGVVAASKKLGLKKIPVKRLDVDPNDPKALKLIAGDNELGKLAEVDDRALSELLKDVMGLDPDGLLGTGFDEKMLANLAMVTRSADEIEDFDAAAEWVGMPEYQNPDATVKVVVSLRSEKDVPKLGKLLGTELTGKSRSCWWPPKEREDPSNYRFEG